MAAGLPVIFMLPMGEMYKWLDQVLGPMAAEVLEILAACVCEDDLSTPWAPQAFRRLHRTLCNQGMDRFEAEGLMREAYNRMLSHLSTLVPEWLELEHYYGLEHSMRGHQTLMLIVRPEPGKKVAYA